MAAIDPLKNLPVLPPTPVAPAKPKAAAESIKVAPAEPKTAKVAPVAIKPKVQPAKAFQPSPPSIGEKARSAAGKAQPPRNRINIVG